MSIGVIKDAQEKYQCSTILASGGLLSFCPCKRPFRKKVSTHRFCGFIIKTLQALRNYINGRQREVSSKKMDM